MGPDKNAVFPNPNIPSLCYIKNVIKNPNIIVGDYTYYDDVNGADRFEEHVTHHYDFIGDRLIIGANSVVASDIPPYSVAAGNPCTVKKKRFDDELIAYLLELRWWDWDDEKIFRNLPALTSGDLAEIRKIKD